MFVYIYALVDPFTDAVRYVGLTRNIAKRLSRYSRPHTKHLANWFNSIKAQGEMPALKVLAAVPESESSACEQGWIRHYREAGCDLLNYTNGGERGYSLSEECRRNLSKAMTGVKHRPLSTEHKAAISRANKGHQRNPNARNLFITLNKARTGIPLTELHKSRVSEGVRRAITAKRQNRTTVTES